MKKIYKYELEIRSSVMVSMPKRHTILCVKNQEGKLCVWAEVTVGAPEKVFEFRIVGTGNPMDTIHSEYIGTAIFGEFVWHVYKVL